MRSTDSAPATNRHLWPLGILLLGLVGWASIEIGWGSLQRSPADFVRGQEGSSVSASSEGDYVFFTFRRTLWVFRRSTMTVTFHSFQESTERDYDIQTSRTYTIDAKNFPLEQLEFQMSERNLTNYLWILNPHTGKAMNLKARRDGILEESQLLDLNKGS